MSEQTQPNPHEKDQQLREFTVDTAAFSELKEGDIILGLNTPEDYDNLENEIAGFFNQGSSYDAGFTKLTRSNSAPQSLLEELRPHRFAGKLKDGCAIVLPNTHYDYKRLDSGKFEAPTIRLWIQAGMYSTGRGKIGETGLLAAYSRTTGKTAGIDFAAHREIKKASSRAQAERLIDSLGWESGAVHQAVAELALSRTVSAGLPTLGKR